ncbi:peptidoglycan-binding protein [Streptomyces lateritius]|uniref:peptidoglycan-binding protein n=1 Tax=Streptomyces lateritius TaxID=67313 RepID=UPI001676862F|nr:peptidoglycan-binding protein [Streptomyces lateritius]GGT91438.1 membrane protein [Streptomyces lateritius]
MSVPVFEEFEPAVDCGCAGCAHQRRDHALGMPVRAGGHPAAHGARRALVLVTAAGVVLGGGGPSAFARPPDARLPGTPADVTDMTSVADVASVVDRASRAESAEAVAPGPDTPQGGAGPLHGAPGPGPQPAPGATPTDSQITVQSLRKTTRTEIINRAKLWVRAQVPYSMEKYWTDGYRQDCSGYISMAWNLRANEWTGSLDRFGERIERTELQPGDILLFHNPADPTKGSHVTVFGGWTDYTHTSYIAYEQVKPRSRKQATPLAYWTHSDRYTAYRYKGIVSGGGGSGAGGGSSAAVAYPGTSKFGSGANNAHVTRLGKLLVQRGGKKYYSQGPGPRWGEADRRATQAFQRAQGWKGEEADGLSGPHTWRLLVNGQGRSIGGSSGSSGPSANAPGFPGRGYFRPGRSSAYVEKLGKQLVKRGYGKHYLSGPGPRWSEADRRNVEAFQRAQGWRGGAADGYPGPETWRRLFR